MSDVFRKKAVFLLLSAVFFISLDRFFKILALNYFTEKYNIIGNILSFQLAQNYNIAFSLPLSGWWLNILIIIILIGLIYWLLILFKRQEFQPALCLSFVLFGAISNMFDRLQYGFVIDYLDLKYFTVFNIADIMIVGGVTCLVYFQIHNKTTS